MQKLAMSIILLLTFSSCATMINGEDQDIQIKSETPHAKIFVDGKFIGEDQVMAHLSRKSDHVVEIKKTGFEDQKIELHKHAQVEWVVFDACFNWFGLLIDGPSGAWNEFDEKEIVVELAKKQQL
ncbi:hypothetical protein [Sediminitomix flava]|uniref:PEGA domain-containing protein n=1 Tax=Sediminitomix flava TaxID=379075 RepID=A0A315ZHG5_SEDFL|nr:hypothetical protein [Sediminitomix flava]PWJ44238.1 hypothetical protein BC781_101588 [Sediminitomix flava]